jgi:signal transduction histidine kinase
MSEPPRTEPWRPGPGGPWADDDWGRRWPRRRPRWARGPRDPGPIRRRATSRMLGGVAEGLSARTGIDLITMRVLIVLATLVSGGAGAAAYVLAWLLIPEAGQDHAIASKALADRRGIALAAGIGSLLIVLLIFASAAGVSWVGGIAWALTITVVGMVLIVRNATPEEQATIRRLAEPLAGLTEGRRSQTVLRFAIAVVLLGTGLGLLLSSGHKASQQVAPVSGAVLLLAAIVLVLGPWWLRIARDLMVERQARARADERADMAARVHDSVLQTLALIQRRASDPQQVIQLARAQERELRSWLFDRRPPGALDADGMTFADGVRLIEQEVEAQHGLPVDAVTVGDCDLDDDLRALLAAGREATVNAVKWSGADVVSIFAEVEPGEVSLFVRDRGRGFDPEAVPSDRKGVTESIRGRMARRGGAAVIRSTKGEGTEVSLTMPRASGRRETSPA